MYIFFGLNIGCFSVHCVIRINWENNVLHNVKLIITKSFACDYKVIDYLQKNYTKKNYKIWLNPQKISRRAQLTSYSTFLTKTWKSILLNGFMKSHAVKQVETRRDCIKWMRQTILVGYAKRPFLHHEKKIEIFTTKSMISHSIFRISQNVISESLWIYTFFFYVQNGILHASSFVVVIRQ